MSRPFSLHKTCRIDFKPSGKSMDSNERTTLLTTARQAGLAISSSCGGTGRCGQCRVIVLSGHVSPPSIAEKDTLTEQELERGERLACQTYIEGDVSVHVPETSIIIEQRMQLESDVNDVTLEPPVAAFAIDIPPPTLDDPRSDLERIAACLPQSENVTIIADGAVIRQITSTARECKWRIAALLRESEIIGVIPPGFKQCYAKGILFP
jgi:uncharacterized 2Fe-2S/4Fe-4S cluster protein (DUF4445 family)